MLFNYSDRRWAESSDRSEKHNEKELHRDGQMGMYLWILSISNCDLLSYHLGAHEVSMFIPNTDPKSASRPCWHKVITLNGVKVNIQNTFK